MSQVVVTATDDASGNRRGGRWAPMPILALGVSLIIMDATIINVAIPTIIGDLSLNASEAEWMNSVYPLSFAALLILLGRAGDRYGRRTLFLIGLVLFGLANLVAAGAGTGGVLIASRLVQGVGGAMILPATLATVNSIYTGRDRGVAFAIWGSTIGGMAAVGPFVGGWLTTDASWRWAFLIKIPVIIVVIVGAVLYVPETTDPHTPQGRDGVGAITSVLGLGFLVFGLIEGQRYGWWTTLPAATWGGWDWPWHISPIVVAFTISGVALTILVTTQLSRQRAGKTVLMDLSLFRIPSFRYGSIAALIVALGEFGLLFALPLFLQGALGYTALRTGTLLLALATGTFLISGFTPKLTYAYGGRAVVVLGLGLEAVAVAGLAASISTTVSGWWLAGWLFLYGVGVGLATAQLTSVILADVPPTHGGQASGMQSTVRQVGSSLGIACLGTMLIVLLGVGTTDRLADVPGLTKAQRADASSMVRQSAGTVIPALSAHPHTRPIGAAATAALVDAARTVSYSAAGILVVGLLAALALPRGRSREEHITTKSDQSSVGSGE